MLSFCAHSYVLPFLLHRYGDRFAYVYERQEKSRCIQTHMHTHLRTLVLPNTAYKGALFQSSGSYKLADNPGFGGPPPVKEEPVKRTRVTKTKGRIDHAAIMADLLRQKKEREAKQELRAAGLSAVP